MAKKSETTAAPKPPSVWDKVNKSSKIPKRFNWRGNTYDLKTITEKQVLQLADDPQFKHITRK